MGPHFAIFCILLALDGHRTADVSWNAGVPLWTALSPTGKVVDAGPFSDWTGPPVAARLGSIVEPSRSAPEPLPRPRELPEALGIVLRASPATRFAPVPARHFATDNAWNDTATRTGEPANRHPGNPTPTGAHRER